MSNERFRRRRWFRVSSSQQLQTRFQNLNYIQWRLQQYQLELKQLYSTSVFTSWSHYAAVNLVGFEQASRLNYWHWAIRVHQSRQGTPISVCCNFRQWEFKRRQLASLYGWRQRNWYAGDIRFWRTDTPCHKTAVGSVYIWTAEGHRLKPTQLVEGAWTQIQIVITLG